MAALILKIILPVNDQPNDVTESASVTTVSIEDKVKMLQDWIALIQRDIDAIQIVRDNEYSIYAKQKSMYDTWLAKRYKAVTRYDKKMRERKNQINEIEAEIAAIQQRPLPGILPPLPVDVEPKRTKWKKTPKTDVSTTEPAVEIPTNIELSAEERAQLNAEAHNNP